MNKGRRLAGLSIAVDGRYLCRPDVGIAIYLQGLLRLLLQEGAHITLVVHRMPDGPDDILKKCHMVVSRNPLRLPFLWEQTWLATFLYRHHFDYYIAPGNTGLPLLYVGKTTLVLTVHDIIPLHFLGTYLRKQFLNMLNYLPSLLIAVLRAQIIMAVSQATADDIRRLFHRRAVPTLIPLRHVALVSKKTPRKHVEKKQQFVYNGGLDPRKNVPALLEGFHRFHATPAGAPYKLVLMGRGYERLQLVIERLRMQNAVIMTGYVDEPTKYALIAESVGVVYPSAMEGYGLPIVEAMLSATVVACGIGGSQREVGGEGALYIEPISPYTVAAALQHIASRNEAQHEALLARQRTQIKKLFATDVDERIVQIFKSP
jgi:glycosyltransferase involved in cell wall biosynthesis